MKTMLNNALVALTLIPLLSGCGKSGTGASAQNQEERRPEAIDDTNSDGQYQAKFITLNPHVNGTIPGSLTMVRDGDRFMTYLRLFAGKPRAWHQQGIHSGSRCPVMRDDTNGDGFIDINEALAVVGPIVIPLDSNMNSQSAGRNFYPLGDLSGYYHYERVASFNRLFDDLYDTDSDETDHITKLAPNTKFGLVGKVVMVQGIDESTLLPETVGTLGKRKSFQTLPITCGIISRTTGLTPGALYTGEIPGPVAEVIEGQDHPAPYEDDTTAGSEGGTVAGTTGTNETDDGEVGDEGGDHSGSTSGTSSGGSTGGSSGGSSAGSSGGTTGETTTGSSGGTSGGTTGRDSGGFIGGFIGGGGGGTSTGGTTGSEPDDDSEDDDHGTTGRGGGGFIGGFIGGVSGN